MLHQRICVRPDARTGSRGALRDWLATALTSDDVARADSRRGRSLYFRCIP
jgi:hypothetical protein